MAEDTTRAVTPSDVLAHSPSFVRTLPSLGGRSYAVARPRWLHSPRLAAGVKLMRPAAGAAVFVPRLEVGVTCRLRTRRNQTVFIPCSVRVGLNSEGG